MNEIIRRNYKNFKIKYFSFKMLQNLIKSTNGSLIKISCDNYLQYIVIKVMIGEELFRLFIKKLPIP